MSRGALGTHATILFAFPQFVAHRGGFSKDTREPHTVHASPPPPSSDGSSPVDSASSTSCHADTSDLFIVMGWEKWSLSDSNRRPETDWTPNSAMAKSPIRGDAESQCSPDSLQGPRSTPELKPPWARGPRLKEHSESGPPVPSHQIHGSLIYRIGGAFLVLVGGQTNTHWVFDITLY